ncbi:torso-like protein isoform X2 [Cimex lectularius]|nr:torso-like protein isoform X2 [Cimex lectularius]XP_014250380.1 torso-like protein isoform X2 [Cimex lectularius]
MKFFTLVIGFLISEIGLTQQHLRVGGAVNLFGRFGYLSISMRVVPRNDSDGKWVFREPMLDVFKSLPTTKRVIDNSENTVFHGDFYMEFCDDVQQLLQAYFREFSIERLDEPWRAFTGSWSDVTLARNLGLNVSYVGSGHCYVLLRLSRHRDSAYLPEHFDLSTVTLQDSVAAQAARLKVGNVPSVRDFVKNFGSHYVSSYVTGNSLYQVLVYTPAVYSELKEKLQNAGLSALESKEIIDFFSPQNAEHFGLVLAASGNSTLAQWAQSSLSGTSYFIKYSSLLKLRGNIKLLKELDSLLGNEALLQLSLRTLAPVFKDKYKSDWFVEVVDNHLKLWELNM